MNMSVRNDYGRGLKLLLEPPYPQEQLSSIVERSCRAYGISLESFAVQARAAIGDASHDVYLDWDCPPPAVLEMLVWADDFSGPQLADHVIYDSPAWLSPGNREQACLLCLAEDEDVGREPYYRVSWALVSSTFCTIHLCPFVRWRSASRFMANKFVTYSNAFEQIALTSVRNQRGWAGKALADRLRAWEGTLTDALRGIKRLSDITDDLLRIQLDFAIAMGTLPSGRNGTLPSGRISVANRACTGSLDWVMSPGGRFNAWPHHGGWDEFRSQRGPEYRRAAFYLTAASLEQGWPVRVGDLVPWGRGITSGSTEWWDLVIGPRIRSMGADGAPLPAFAEMAGKWPRRSVS